MTDRTSAPSRPVIEEVHFRNEVVYVSLVVNRRHKTARVVDFLAGNFPQKVAAIDAIAIKQGIERVYTLVEKEESSGWSKVGYVREGSIPGYYKRSDAYMMGRVVGVMPLVPDEAAPMVSIADAARAEKTLVAAKKLLDSVPNVPKGVKAAMISEFEINVMRDTPKARKLTPWFEDRFGRAGTRLHAAARPSRTSVKLTDQLVSADLQEPFGNAYLQLASYPSKPEDAALMVAALGALTEQLRTREITCTFAVAPSDSQWTSAAMLTAGFKKTGLLAQHLLLGEKRSDAILWTRKPAVAADADAA